MNIANMIGNKKAHVQHVEGKYAELGNIIKSILAEHGKECLKNTEEFIEKVRGKGVAPGIAYQLGLVLEFGNVRDFILKKNTMIDINNIVIHTQRETGLTRNVIGNVLSAIFEAVDLPREFTTAVLVSENKLEERVMGLVDENRFTDLLNHMEKAIRDLNGERIEALAVAFKYCVDAGIPRALYLKGLYYKLGAGGEKDSSLAFKYLEAASKAGYPKANAELGDYYFNHDVIPNYPAAFEYYTQIGAVGANKNRRNNLKIILGEWERNKRQMVSFGILIFIIFAFYYQLGSGMLDVSNETHWIVSIIAGLLSMAVTALMYLANFYTKYITNVLFVNTVIAIAMLATIIAL